MGVGGPGRRKRVTKRPYLNEYRGGGETTSHIPTWCDVTGVSVRTREWGGTTTTLVFVCTCGDGVEVDTGREWLRVYRTVRRQRRPDTHVHRWDDGTVITSRNQP